jgi:hypothetical protein
MNWGFQIVLCLALVWIVFGLGRSLFGAEFRAGFFTVKGLQSLTEKDLTGGQRTAVVAMAAMPKLCWVYGLIQLALVSVRFRRGEVFSEAVIRRFQGFGWALLVMSVADAFRVPAVVGYLVWLGKIDPLANPWQQYLLGSSAPTSLLAAVLVVIVTKIMRIAMQISDEMRLTI